MKKSTFLFAVISLCYLLCKLWTQVSASCGELTSKEIKSVNHINYIWNYVTCFILTIFIIA